MTASPSFEIPCPDNTFRVAEDPVYTFTPHDFCSQLALASRPLYHNTTNTNEMAAREEDSSVPVGSSDIGLTNHSTAASLEDALSASLELLNNSIEQTAHARPENTLSTSNTTGGANTMEESNQALLTALLSHQRINPVVPDPSINALHLDDSSRVTQYHTFDGTAEEDVDKNTSGPAEPPESDHIDQAISEPLSNLSGDVHSLGAQLESIYQTTTSPEMKQIIACLVHLDTALTHQTHLNNLHEAHTAKNFREQRHLNKDRKLRLLETIQNVNKKFARFDAERMETEKLAKQCEIRVNGYGLQLQGLKERVKMLADGGEWMEAELTKMAARFEVLQQENAKLKGQNKDLKRRFRGMQDEVDVLKERDGVWERRMTALEELVKDREESEWHKISFDKEHVFDAVRFSVGNYRVFSMYH